MGKVAGMTDRVIETRIDVGELFALVEDRLEDAREDLPSLRESHLRVAYLRLKEWFEPQGEGTSEEAYK